MEKNMENFNEVFRKRTKVNALRIMSLYAVLRKIDELRIAGNQLVRSGTSVAANFRAACRARSDAEYFSKLCIVVEECDEALFWLELLTESGKVDQNKLDPIVRETTELMKVFAKTRKTLKERNE